MGGKDEPSGHEPGDLPKHVTEPYLRVLRSRLMSLSLREAPSKTEQPNSKPCVIQK